MLHFMRSTQLCWCQAVYPHALLYQRQAAQSLTFLLMATIADIHANTGSSQKFSAVTLEFERQVKAIHLVVTKAIEDLSP